MARVVVASVFWAPLTMRRIEKSSLPPVMAVTLPMYMLLTPGPE